MKTTEILYSIMNKETEKLLDCTYSSNEGREYCGEYTYALEDNSGASESYYKESFNVVQYLTSEENVDKTLNEDMQWWNSEPELPVNPYLGKQKYVKVKVTVTTEIEEV